MQILHAAHVLAEDFESADSVTSVVANVRFGSKADIRPIRCLGTNAPSKATFEGTFGGADAMCGVDAE